MNIYQYVIYKTTPFFKTKYVLLFILMYFDKSKNNSVLFLIYL